MSPELTSLPEQPRNRPVSIASIGECMIELRHIDHRTLTLHVGGDTLNSAVYLRRMSGKDVSVDYVTALGDDAYSDLMIDTWRSEGLGTELVARLPGRLPGLYLIRVDDAGERSFTYYRSHSAARDMLAGDRGEAVASALRQHDVIYLSGITLSILDDPSREVLWSILAEARDRGAMVVFDSNYRPHGWSSPEEARNTIRRTLRYVTLAMPTLSDEERLFGDESPEDCARRLFASGVEEVAVKVSADGCVVFDHDERAEHIPAEPVSTIVDTTAAGDSFNAAYLAARLAGATPAEAGVLGNRLAGIVITYPGALAPTEATQVEFPLTGGHS